MWWPVRAREVFMCDNESLFDECRYSAIESWSFLPFFRITFLISFFIIWSMLFSNIITGRERLCFLSVSL